MNIHYKIKKSTFEFTCKHNHAPSKIYMTQAEYDELSNIMWGNCAFFFHKSNEVLGLYINIDNTISEFYLK